MYGIQIVFFIFIYFGLTLLYLTPNVNGQNKCFTCSELDNCPVPLDFLKFSSSGDRSKVVEKVPADPANPNLDRCLRPGYKLSETLTGTVCSGSSDGTCHALGESTTNTLDVLFHCGKCSKECDCRKKRAKAKGHALKEDVVILTICLAAIYIRI